jgi:hypothetical protein
VQLNEKVIVVVVIETSTDTFALLDDEDDLAHILHREELLDRVYLLNVR